ncbi:MAG: tripartite tricarboxylate transporter TctB family protein [Bacteroidota bacterium]
MRKRDIISGLGTMLIGVLFLVGSAFMPWKGSGFDWYGAPGLVPAILAGLLFLCGLILYLRAVSNEDFYARLEAEEAREIAEAAAQEAQTAGQSSTQVQELELPQFLRVERWRILTVIALLAAYIFLLVGRIPYIPATAIFVAAFIWIFKGGGWLKSASIGLITSVAVWFVFYRIFAVVLP